MRIVEQHCEEAAVLSNIRSALVHAPHVRLHHLRRTDDRVAAHLDGLAVAGTAGDQLCAQALAEPGRGEVFTATVRAIESKDRASFNRVMAVATAMPRLEAGAFAGLGWTSAQHLQGVIKNFLESAEPSLRRFGVVACALHRVDPGPALDRSLDDKDVALRARALRTIGELGRRDLLPAARAALTDDDEICRFWAAWTAVMLGDRAAGLDRLIADCHHAGPLRLKAMRAAFGAMDGASAHSLLRTMAKDPKDARVLIQGAGMAGDPAYVPWLIKQMESIETTRVAGESFSLITGLDLSYLDLDRKPPENLELGPNDDASDANVDRDEDEDLPWPDAEKIRRWWDANASRFAGGSRYFMGQPLLEEHCAATLRDGFQRQRSTAAVLLCILAPGTKLFNTSAPAWRQQRQLATAK